MSEVSQDVIDKRFAADAAYVPVQYRKVVEGCESWGREELIAVVKDLATAQDILTFHRSIDKQMIEKLTGIGRGFESQTRNMMKMVLMASTTMAMVTERVSLFLDEETKANMREMSKSIEAMLAIKNPDVEWPVPAPCVS